MPTTTTTPLPHEYTKEELAGKYINYDAALYRASINVLDIKVTELITGQVILEANYEFYAQLVDGKRWIKDVAVWIGPREGLPLDVLRKHILNEVTKAREELKNTRLNGTEV